MYAGVKGDVLDLSLVANETGNEGSTLIAVLSKHDEKTLLTLFHLPNSIVDTRMQKSLIWLYIATLLSINSTP